MYFFIFFLVGLKVSRLNSIGQELEDLTNPALPWYSTTSPSRRSKILPRNMPRLPHLRSPKYRNPRPESNKNTQHNYPCLHLHPTKDTQQPLPHPLLPLRLTTTPQSNKRIRPPIYLRHNRPTERRLPRPHLHNGRVSHTLPETTDGIQWSYLSTSYARTLGRWVYDIFIRDTIKIMR